MSMDVILKASTNKKSANRVIKHQLAKNSSDGDDLVQVVFTNLIKPKKPKLEGTNFEFRSIIVAGKEFTFNANRLYELEPSNTLLNPNSAEYKKRINPSNHILEYIEPLPDFTLIIDYLNGYHVNKFALYFKKDYLRVQDFKIMVKHLGMTNLLSQIEYLYPLLNINSMLVNLSRYFIMNLEPDNKLFDKSNISHLPNVYCHFTDKDLFHEYLQDYIQGKNTTSQTIHKIKQQKDNGNNYLISKIENDIIIYGLLNLHINLQAFLSDNSHRHAQHLSEYQLS